MTNTNTRFAVAMAMDRLCRQRDYDGITVNEICAAAGVSRSAFYRAFEDKYEIGLWIQRLAFDSGFGQIGRTLTWREGYIVSDSVHYLVPDLVRASNACEGLRSTSTRFVELFKAAMTRTITDYKRCPLDEELAFLVDYYARSLLLLTPEYVGGGEAADVERMASRFEQTVPSRLYDLLNEPVHPAPATAFEPSSFYLFAMAGGNGA